MQPNAPFCVLLKHHFRGGGGGGVANPRPSTAFSLSRVGMYAISWREQVNFQWNDDEVSFVLDQYAELDF